MVEFTDIAGGLSVMFAGSPQDRLKCKLHLLIITKHDFYSFSLF